MKNYLLYNKLNLSNEIIKAFETEEMAISFKEKFFKKIINDNNHFFVFLESILNNTSAFFNYEKILFWFQSLDKNNFKYEIEKSKASYDSTIFLDNSFNFIRFLKTKEEFLTEKMRIELVNCLEDYSIDDCFSVIEVEVK